MFINILLIYFIKYNFICILQNNIINSKIIIMKITYNIKLFIWLLFI